VVTSGPLGKLLQAGGFAGLSTDWRAEAVPTGFAPLDRLLPAGGVRRGSLVEWLCRDEASGAAALASAVACRLAEAADRESGAMASAIVVVDRKGRLYPPAVLGWLERAGGSGRPTPRLVVARPAHEADEMWAIDQALRCRGVAAVLAWPARIHATAMRRWQLAARASLAVGLFMRPLTAGREPSWAEARIAVAAQPGGGLAVRRLRLSLVGGPWAGEADLQERSVEIGLDLVRGCAAGAPAEPAAPRILERERMACRAS